MSSGSLAGFPVVDVVAVLYDGSYHEVDSNALAFQIAARGAFREAMPKAGAKLLEPIMKVSAVFHLLPALYSVPCGRSQDRWRVGGGPHQLFSV